MRANKLCLYSFVVYFNNIHSCQVVKFKVFISFYANVVMSKIKSCSVTRWFCSAPGFFPSGLVFQSKSKSILRIQPNTIQRIFSAGLKNKSSGKKSSIYI